jgi:transcription antitermination factor NusG
MIRYLSFNGKPAIIKDDQIEAIKKMLTGDVEGHVNTTMRPGKRVKIMVGPLTGVEGTIERINGRSRLVVRIECLNRALSVRLSEEMLACCAETM